MTKYAYFRTEPMAPGRYKTNLGYMDFTLKDLKDIRNNTTKMIKAGVVPRVLLRHDDTKKGDPAEGEASEIKATECEGDVTRSIIIKGGNIAYEFRVPEDTDVCNRLRDGRIPATSPSFSHYEDGLCRKWGMVTRHISLTPAPLNPNQPPVKEVCNFSESKGPVALAEPVKIRKEIMKNDTQTQEPTADSAPKDLVESTIVIDEKQLTELFRASNITPPSASLVTNMKEWVEQLVSSLQVIVANKAASPHTATAVGVGTREEPDAALAYNFSEHEDPQVRELFEKHKKLEDKRRQEVRETATAGIKKRLDQKWIPSSVRSSLSNRLEAVNFAEGDDGSISEAPTLTVSEALDLVEKAIPEASRISSDEVNIEDHPSGEEFFDPNSPESGEREMTMEEADAIVDREEKSGFVLNISS